MTCEIIATGSSGNAVLLGGSILIDIGVPWKRIEPYRKRIELVLLTHIHGDHFKPSTVRALHRERPTIRWACREWMVGSLLECGVDRRVIDVCADDEWLRYSPMLSVFADATPHNVPNCCWHIFAGEERAFYATDCSSLDGIQARGYDLYMVERNHNRAEMERRIKEKEADGQFIYEYEAMRNHLSEEQALEWLAANAGPNSRYVFLHQHEDRKGANHEPDTEQRA